MYLYAKDPYEAKYQYLIKILEKVGIGDMRDVYKNINYYNPHKENKILIVFDDMIATLNSDQLFIRGKKLNISLVFLTQSYFKVSKILD